MNNNNRFNSDYDPRYNMNGRQQRNQNQPNNKYDIYFLISYP